jgi:hypothetical protein
MKEVVLDRLEAAHERLGTAGFVLSILALCLALTGGAFAASKYVTKKEAEKIAKKQAQKYANSNPGAPGANGTNGTNGTDGANGKDGISPTGTAFSGNANGCTEGGVKFEGANTTVACNGVKGANGNPGTSVTNTTLNSGDTHCPQGGAEFKVGTTGAATYACNGQTGFTDTLPKGKTETGLWTVTIPPSAAFEATTVSFNIPLANTPQVVMVPAGEEEEFETECPGGSFAEPAAAEGYVCFFTETAAPLLPFATLAHPQGVILDYLGSEGEGVIGSWAVTAG